MTAEQFENLTDVELAANLYLALIGNDDQVADSVAELYDPAVKMASALWNRLRGPYCTVEWCGNPHTEHFPWCAEHLAQWQPSFGPDWQPEKPA